MRELSVDVVGVTPLIMHNARLANPLDEWAIKLKEISSKRTKSTEDYLAMAKIEFMGGLYLEGKKIVIPSENWEGGLFEAAKKNRLGKVVKAACIVEEASELSFDGPKDPEKRCSDQRYWDQRSVKIKGSRLVRTRPIFNNWAASVIVTYDDVQLDKKKLISIFDVLGRAVGLGDYRPKYGRFDVAKAEDWSGK